MRLYIVRHGDPDYEHDTITEEGHREAQALSKRFAKTGLTRIYTSPMGRAKATMRYTADRLGLPWAVEDWTHEIGGFDFHESPWGDLTAWDIPSEIMRSSADGDNRETWDWKTELEKLNFEGYLRQLQRKSDDFLGRQGYVREGNRYRITRQSEDKVAVFCHGGFGLTWISCLLNIPLPVMWGGFWMPPTSVTTILFDCRVPGYASPRCIGFADVSHLYAEGLSVLPRGIKANFY